MQPHTGEIYSEAEVAEMFKRDPDEAKKLVYVQGDPESVKAMSDAIKGYRAISDRDKRKAKNKAARASKKKNR